MGDANVILQKSNHCITFPVPVLNTDIWAKCLSIQGIHQACVVDLTLQVICLSFTTIRSQCSGQLVYEHIEMTTLNSIVIGDYTN